MKLIESKEKFINAWGTLGTSWGINRTMAQVHALLLVSPDALSAEDIMEELTISRGNTNMNVRTLIDWGLVFKETRSGERKEFFTAEKDIWKVFKQIAKERRKRELEPIFKVLDEVKNVEGDKRDKNIKSFVDTIEDIERLLQKMREENMQYRENKQNLYSKTLENDEDDDDFVIESRYKEPKKEKMPEKDLKTKVVQESDEESSDVEEEAKEISPDAGQNYIN